MQDAPKPGIVYAATRRHTEEIAQALADRGIDAASYHGGMAARERREIQNSFMSGQTEVIAATSAFGMGVDKSDVRFVYHFEIPDSLDSYYQEVGRCGRDGKPAEAVLSYRPEDLRVPKFLKSGGKIAQEKIREVGEALQDAAAPVEIEALQDATDLSARKVEKAVNRLEDAGVVERLPTGEAALSDNATNLDDAAREAAAEEEKRRAYEALRMEKMQAYAELSDCRREYLLRYFGDEEITGPCGRCDNCKNAQSEPRPKGQSNDGDKIEILFDDGGRKTLSLSFLLEHNLLTS